MTPAHRRLVDARTNLQDEPCEFDVTGQGPPEAPDYGRLEVGHVLDLVEQGADHERIMDETGLTRQQINALLRKVAIALGYEEHGAGRPRALTPGVARRVLELAREGRKPPSIAAALGIGEGAVRYELAHPRGEE